MFQIFEQSRLATETGAALHLAPNANGILRRLGICAEEFGANTFERVCNHSYCACYSLIMILTS